MSLELNFHELFCKAFESSSQHFLIALEPCTQVWTGLNTESQRKILSAVQSALFKTKLDWGWCFGEDESAEHFDQIISQLIFYSSLDSSEIPPIINTVQQSADLVLRHLDPTLQIVSLDGPDNMNFPINMKWLLQHSGSRLKSIIESSSEQSLDLSELCSSDFRSVALALVNHKAVFETESLIDFRKVLQVIEDHDLTFLEPAIRQYLIEEAKKFLLEGNGQELILLYMALIPHLNNPESCLQVSPLLQTIWDCVLGASPDAEIFNLEACSFVLSTMLHADSKNVLEIESLQIQNLISAMTKQHGLDVTARRLEDSLEGLEDADEVIEQVREMFQSATCVHEGIHWEKDESQENSRLIIDIDSIDSGLKMYEVARKLFHHPLLELYALIFSKDTIEVRVNTTENYPQGQNQQNLDFVYYHLSNQAQELEDPQHCRLLFNSNAFWKSHQNSEKKYENVALYTPQNE